MENASIAKPGCGPTRSRQDIACGTRSNCVGDSSEAMARYEPFPTGGTAFKLDPPKPELENHVAGLSGKVRSYKMTSVWRERDQLEQRGSGPNFQGRYLTLCTCRHEIRAEKANPQEWRDWWFAGYTGLETCDRLWLFYLARIKEVYASQAELWEALPACARQAKCSRHYRLGDVYQPNQTSLCADPWDAAHYYPPLVGHSHRSIASDLRWKKDIEFYHRKFKRHAPCLVADPELTFLWQKPMLFLEQHSRNMSWASVRAMLLQLQFDAKES